MTYIFFDESGDLGFNFSKEKTSKYFLVTFLIAQNKNPHQLYNDSVITLLKNIIHNEYFQKDQITLVASRRETNPHLNTIFTKEITRSLFNKTPHLIEIQIKSPHEEKCLQLVDTISWSLFKEHEYFDNEYSLLIKNKTTIF